MSWTDTRRLKGKPIVTLARAINSLEFKERLSKVKRQISEGVQTQL